MSTSSPVAELGALLADPSRTEIIQTLLDGRAFTVGELARHVGIAASTASEHLARLVDGGLVIVEPQGRHRYHRIAGAHVADLFEHLLAVTAATAGPAVRVPAGLRFARSCYDHLAGQVAVALYDQLHHDGLLEDVELRPTLTPLGRARFEALGLDLTGLERPGGRPVTRRCVDWSERRHHLAGKLGALLLAHLVEHGWVTRQRSSRAVTVTAAGRDALRRHLAVDVDRIDQARSTSSLRSSVQ